MMSMARGMRLGIMKQKRKKKTMMRKRKMNIINKKDDDESKQQLGGKTSFELIKCSGLEKQETLSTAGLEKQEGSKKQMNISSKTNPVVDGYLTCRSSGYYEDYDEFLQIGHTLNLSDILFTQDRDFLVTYKDRNRPVHAKHLEGKVVVLHFVPLVSKPHLLMPFVLTLVDIYNALLPNAAFEVVFIGVKLPKYDSKPEKLLKNFERFFSMMPWPAIPFSDIYSPEYYTTRLRFPSTKLNSEDAAYSVVVDPRGVVLQIWANYTFYDFGPQGYPFSCQRIDFLTSQDKEALDHPSITKLLASPERDYLINNKNQVVPLHTLEDKTVALYFYQDSFSPDLTKALEMAYEQFAKTENFEIVFVYLPYIYDNCGYASQFTVWPDDLLSTEYPQRDKFLIPDTYESCQSDSEREFWLIFRKMPWLALPFKDSKWFALKRIFKLPWDHYDDWDPDHRLVIVGPQGKFIEPYGAFILLRFGISACPFTRQKVAELEAKSIKKLKLKSFWDPDTCFIQENGSEVKLSQFVGKPIIVVFEGDYGPVENEFWRKLKARYLHMKDTDDEFDVICICQKKGYSSWLRHPPIIKGSNIFKLLARLFGTSQGLLAFDQTGRVVRKTSPPSIESGNMVFPFHAAGLEEDAVRELVKKLEWDNF